MYPELVEEVWESRVRRGGLDILGQERKLGYPGLGKKGWISWVRRGGLCIQG